LYGNLAGYAIQHFEIDARGSLIDIRIFVVTFLLWDVAPLPVPTIIRRRGIFYIHLRLGLIGLARSA
jgi:hypothetical protein